MKIDWINTGFHAMCLTCAFFTAYGGDVLQSLSWVFIAWADWYIESRKGLPRETFLQTYYFK